ncbi:MAG: hypothetical protein ACE5J7_00705 [Candidatus Aenigmatarchaeota archaeon]
MSLSKLFWFTAISTVVFLAMYVYGFDLLNIVLALLLVNMIVLKASHDEVFERFKFGNVLSSKMEKIEDVMLDLTRFMRDKEGHSSKASDVTLGGIDQSFKKHTDTIKIDMDDKLERMAKKAIEIENRLNEIKKTFSAAVASLDDRIHTIEKPEETVESDSFVELPEEFS